MATADSTTGRSRAPEDGRPPTDAPPSQAQPALTLRSLLIGLAGVAGIAALTPFNNHLLENSYLIGGTMPVAVTLLALLLAAGVNGLLHRWVPRQALRPRELSVVLVMLLIGCSLPGTGFMDAIPHGLVGIINRGFTNAEASRLLQQLGLPHWVLPALDGTVSDPVIGGFVNRSINTQDGWLAAVPWGAWVLPALSWGLMAALLLGAVLFGSVLIFRQWAHNERLPFPIATIYHAIIEPPARGQAFNALLRSWAFWLAVAAVVLLHTINGLALYLPQHVPAIPLGFDLQPILTDGPFRFSEDLFQRSQIFFAVVGITYFLQTKIAFSLWFFYAALQLARIGVAQQGGEITAGVKSDQIFGAMLAFTVLMLWTAREHLRVVFGQMWRGRRDGEPDGGFLSYRLAGWGFVACSVGLVIWMIAAGSTPAAAVVTVVALLLVFLVVARVVAETGMAYVQINWLSDRTWLLGADSGLFRTTPRSYFWTAFFGSSIANETREAASVYTTHALHIADREEQQRPRGRLGVYLLAAALALVVSFIVSGASTLVMQYNFSSTLSPVQNAPLNRYTVDGTPNRVIDPTLRYAADQGTREIHSHAAHVGAGAGVTAVLGVLRARFVAWPLHPLGFLLMHTYPLRRMWFSIFLGWLCKSLMIRFGGAQVLRSARPLFIGLVVGEAVAAGLWLVVNISRAAAGLNYELIYFTP